MPEFLRLPAVAVSGCACIDDVDVAALMQVRSQAFEVRMNGVQEARLVGLGVGFVRHADVEMKSALAWLRERARRLCEWFVRHWTGHEYRHQAADRLVSAQGIPALDGRAAYAAQDCVRRGACRVRRCRNESALCAGVNVLPARSRMPALRQVHFHLLPGRRGEVALVTQVRSLLAEHLSTT